MLIEREEIHQDSNDWIIDEALNSHHLQTGGTFKNVLTRRLDEVVTPCFTKIIAFLDQNCNLNILQNLHPKMPLFQLWMKIFGSQRAQEELLYSDIMVGGQKVPMRDEGFICKFPFSWLVKELMDSQFDNSRSIGG